MTAREMFEKLGYRCIKSDRSIWYINDSDKENYRNVEFYFCDCTFNAIGNYGDPLMVNVKELEAINKQCEEIGWFEEEMQEIKKETNFEHYYEDFLKIGSGSFGVTDGKVKPCYYMSCSQCDIKRINNSGHCRIDAIKWLASPYKKPTYKLTQCEYDMLDTIFEKEARFSTVYLIGELKKKGYFENIKCDSKVLVKDILANCEVIE